VSEPTGPAGGVPADADAVPRCYRHPDRETWIRCQRCDRPICPDCMVAASVGFQCPACVREGAKATRSGRAAYGGARSSNPMTTTLVLIGLNVLVWLAILGTGGDRGRLFDRLTLMPTGRCETADGAGYYPSLGQGGCLATGHHWVSGVSDGALWQVVTSMFAHVEFWHIASNMLALYFLGPLLEGALGRARFLGVYLVAGLTASAAVMLFSGATSQTLGASGAMFGLIGALLVLALKTRGDVSFLGTWLLLALLFTFFGPGNISWQGHLGGLVGGALVAATIVFAPRGPNRSLLQWSGIAVVAFFALALVVLRAFSLAT
jgi:membrane associated rhomboid family serine protease